MNSANGNPLAIIPFAFFAPRRLEREFGEGEHGETPRRAFPSTSANRANLNPANPLKSRF